MKKLAFTFCLMAALSLPFAAAAECNENLDRAANEVDECISTKGKGNEQVCLAAMCDTLVVILEAPNSNCDAYQGEYMASRIALSEAESLLIALMNDSDAIGLLTTWIFRIGEQCTGI
ncbi:MAG: hypothetical protein ACE363_05250 [Alphaproteobacteria bacterium]